jgi:hypothetical protein
MRKGSAGLADARGFGYSATVRPQTVVFVEPPNACWDRRMDRVREGEEEIPGIGTLTLAGVARGERDPRGFRRPSVTFCSRPDVLWGLGRPLVGEPRFIRRVSTYVRVGVRGWLMAPLAPARA